MAEPLIHVKNLTKRFGDVLAVDDISFQVKKGELVGLMGPNGAGKSTSMRLLTGFMQPNAGRINIVGYDVQQSPQHAQAKIGYLPETGAQYGTVTVYEYLCYLARIYGVEDVEKAIALAVKLVRCGDYIYRSLETLSKGMLQRVYLAGAVLHDPPVLILDEPTDGLDPNQKHEMRLVLKQLSKSKAIIVSTHILEEAEAICDRVLIISHGKIVADMAPKDLAKQGKGDIQVAFRVLTTNKGRKK